MHLLVWIVEAVQRQDQAQHVLFTGTIAPCQGSLLFKYRNRGRIGRDTRCSHIDVAVLAYYFITAALILSCKCGRILPALGPVHGST